MSQTCNNLQYFFGAKTTVMVFKYNRKFLKVRLDLKIVCLPLPDRPNPRGANSKYFAGPLKATKKNIS